MEPRYKSKMHVIQLAVIANAKTIKKYGFSSVLIPLLRDLKILENNGIEVQKMESRYKFRGSISVIVADNLGSHGIGGFQESFNSLRNCTFCMATPEQMKAFHSVDHFERCTVASFSEQVKCVEEFLNMANIYGLEAASRVNKLQIFHVIKCLPSDIAHDLFEGIVCDVLTCLVHHFVQTSLFTLGDLEERMTGFPYKGTHKVNKPRPLANQLAQLKIRQKASQIRCLLHLFHLLIGDRIEEGNPKWEVLLVLCDVVDTLTAPVLSKSEALFLYDLVEQFHSLFANEFPDFLLKPKAHFLLHYPHQISEFGPLMACWALRFDGKHSFFKEIATRLKNRQNVCKTLAYRHQYHQALCHTSPSFLADEAVSHTANSNKVQVRLLLEGIQHVLSPLIGREEEVCQCSSVQGNGTVYGEGCAVVVGFDCDLYQFAKMKSCFIIGGSPYLLCKRQQTI